MNNGYDDGLKQINGIWHYRFNYSGKTFAKSTRTGNKALARKVIEQARKDAIETVVLGKQESITLEKAFTEYTDSKKNSGEHHNYLSYVKKMLGSRTNKQREEEEIYGFDGDMKFVELKTSDVQRLVLERRKAGYRNTTILHELNLLSQTVKLCKKLGYATPTIDIAAIRKDSNVKPEQGRDRFLSKEEVERLLIELKGDHYDFVVAILATAARHTEIAEMTWDQVDIGKKTISLYRNKVGNESTFPMTDRFYNVMKKRFDEKRDDQVYVFEDTTETGAARQYTNTSLHTACKRARIKPCGYHLLRHSVATWVAMSTGNPMVVQQMLGHSTVQMSMRYVHRHTNKDIATAVDVLNAI